MAYCHRAISNEETLLVLARPHWIYIAKGVLWTAACISSFFWFDKIMYNYWTHNAINFEVDLYFVTFTERFTPFRWMGGALGLVLFWTYFSIYLSYEVGLTNQRYIYKRGLFFIKTEQVDLEDIRAEDINHGLLGWLFRYGYIHLDALFTEDLYLPAISNPYALIKASHRARAHHPQTKYDKEALEVNLERLEEQEEASSARAKFKRLHDGLLQRFRKAS